MIWDTVTYLASGFWHKAKQASLPEWISVFVAAVTVVIGNQALKISRIQTDLQSSAAKKADADNLGLQCLNAAGNLVEQEAIAKRAATLGISQEEMYESIMAIYAKNAQSITRSREAADTFQGIMTKVLSERARK